MATAAMVERPRRRADRFGRRAEAMCALALRIKGYRILARRFRSPVGEIDIVARRGATLAIVEVKARSTVASALQAVTARQRLRLQRAAMAFIAARPSKFVPHSKASVRFDLMLVAPWRWPRHITNAWLPDEAALRRTGW